jgi:hypothetical protein
MPVRPIRVIDLQRVPPVPRLRAVPVPPPLPRRPHALPPPLPAPVARRLRLNRKALAIAGAAALLLVSGALAWAATHPTHRTRGLSIKVPDVVAFADSTPATPVVFPVTRDKPVPRDSLPEAPVMAPDVAKEFVSVESLDAVPLVLRASLSGDSGRVKLKALAAEALAEKDATACDTFGTSVDFDPNPVRAAKEAARAQKLLMVLHVSGNFEDAAFT